MKLTEGQIQKIIAALEPHRFDVYADEYCPPESTECWPSLEFEHSPNGLNVNVEDVEQVLRDVEL